MSLPFFMCGVGHGTGECESMCVSNSESTCEYVSCWCMCLCMSISMCGVHVCAQVHVSACLDVCEVFGCVCVCCVCFSFIVAGTTPFLVSSLLPDRAEIVKHLPNVSKGKFLMFCHFCGAKPPWLFSTLPALMAVQVRDTCAIPTHQS